MCVCTVSYCMCMYGIDKIISALDDSFYSLEARNVRDKTRWERYRHMSISMYMYVHMCRILWYLYGIEKKISALDDSFYSLEARNVRDKTKYEGKIDA